MRATQIYMIRHGESEGNKIRAFLGHTDLDITELGHFQAESTALFLENIEVDAIYSSDLMRAYNTALHTAEKKGMDVIKNSALREIFAGEWENRLFDDLEKEYLDSYWVWRNNIGLAQCDGGESVADLQRRIVDEITLLAEKHKGETIFIFTHATPIRTFKAFCDKKVLDGIKDIPWASNASVSHFEYIDGKFTVVDYCIDYFHGNNITKVPPNV